MKNYDFIDISQRPFMYTIYGVVLFTTVKHPHNRSVGKLRRDNAFIKSFLWLKS